MINQEVLTGMTKMSDEQFAKSAYREVLLRDPAPSELARISDQIQNGTSREKTLFLLRVSEEGMAARASVKDLRVRDVSMGEILCHDNLTFQTAAYLATLGRAPEELAKQDFEKNLREEKIVKITYVHDLAASPEGQAWGSRIPGFRKAWIKQRLKDSMRNWPIFNRVWANVHGIRQHLKVSGIREEELQYQINANDLEVSARLDRIEQDLAFLMSRGVELPGSHLGTSYKQFEDRMRGTHEEILERLRIYDAVFRRVRGQVSDMPVLLDLGCGRGEMLEVAQDDYGFFAMGVDMDASMLKDCEEKDLNAVQQNLVDYIYHAESESVDLISMIQVAEHLPMNLLADVLAECYRVLRPGGALIVETPNPENMIIGSCNFYFDPTHVNKIPPALLETVTDGAGFAERETVRLHPYGAVDVGQAAGQDAVQQMAGFFNLCADYAVIAYKLTTE